VIDFRYHLVSLVSVFLALAVGIVLGAGPLKGQIGDTLTQGVESLRAEKNQLRSDLDTANAARTDRDAFITDVTPALVRDQLAGRAVVVVRLPGVEDDAAKSVVDTVTQAGGTVTGQVTVGAGWTDPGRSTERGTVAADLAETVPPDAGGGSAATGDSGQQLARFLADAVVGTGPAAARDGEAGQTVLDRLGDADLISIKGDLSGLAGAAVVLAPGIAGDTVAKPTVPPDVATAYVELADALDDSGGGAVVTGPASSATSGGVVAAVRGTDVTNGRVSTVDTGGSPMGAVTTVLALREQLAGGVGQYGFGDGATAEMPALSTSTVTPAAPAPK
jgi:hypothetical protein